MADRLLRGPAQGEDLALDRPDRRAGARRQPGPGSRPGARSRARRGRRDARARPRSRPRRAGHPRRATSTTSARSEHLAAGLPPQRRRGRAPAGRGSTAASPGSVNSRSAARREPGLQLAALTRAEPLHAQVQATPSARSAGAAPRPRRGRAPRAAPRGTRTRTPSRCPAASSAANSGHARAEAVDMPHDRVLAPVGLAHGGEHPGGDAGRARAGLVALEHPDPEATASGAPGTGEADRPAAHDHRIQVVPSAVMGAQTAQGNHDVPVATAGAAGFLGHDGLSASSPAWRAIRATIPAPALPGSGSDGRRPDCRPLSPSTGLPL